jgi:hypothetical protein
MPLGKRCFGQVEKLSAQILNGGAEYMGMLEIWARGLEFLDPRYLWMEGKQRGYLRITAERQDGRSENHQSPVSGVVGLADLACTSET